MLKGHANSTKRRNEKKKDKANARIAFTAVIRETLNDADCGQ